MSAVPTLDTAASGSRFGRLNRLIGSEAAGALGAGLLAFAAALAIGAVLIVLSGRDPIAAYGSLFGGRWGPRTGSLSR